jgi:hypothetical protein
MIDKGEMDPKYDLVTYSMDGTHNLIRKTKGVPDQSYSYKLKDIAYNILVI